MKKIIKLLTVVLVVIALTGCESEKTVTLDDVHEFCEREGYVLLSDDDNAYEKAADELSDHSYIVYSPEDWDSGEALADMIYRVKEMGHWVFEYGDDGWQEMCFLLNDYGYLVFENEDELFEKYRVTEDDMKEYFAVNDYIVYQRGTNESPLVEYLSENGWIVYPDEDELRRAIDEGEVFNEDEPKERDLSGLVLPGD